ncbi:MAG: hypothetical protein IVW52_07275 [Acidimicrobiales bacterium]|nr:hypothetical protein [Acidimicrobiales bacterium]
MSPASTPSKKLVALPSAIGDSTSEEPAGPATALGRLLSRQRHAPDLLAEARHRHGVARRSVSTAEGATREARDAVRVYTNLRREVDPRQVRRLRFVTGFVLTPLLCLIGAAAIVLIVWNLGWSWRIAVPLILAVLAVAVAWRAVARLRQGMSIRPFVLIGAITLVFLTALHVLTTLGSRTVALLSGLGLAALVVGAVTAATWVVEHTESKVVASARRPWRAAEGRRLATVDLASKDEDAAEHAEEVWLSLVEEEARLAVAEGGTAPESWVEDLVAHARRAARPEA